MSNTTRRQSPPKPILFTTSNGGKDVLNFKVDPKDPCQIVSLSKNHDLGLSLQKSQGMPVVKASLHRAKVASIFDLGESGLSITFDTLTDWKMTSTVFMNRESMEELRNKLNKFLDSRF